MISRLFRRRQVWLPTWQGWLLLALLVAAVAALGATRIVGFLTPQAPAPGARVLVVEGWLEQADLRLAIAALGRGRYERVLTTGGPVESWDDPAGMVSSAERAASFLAAHAPAATKVTAVPAPASAQDRTYLSAVVLRDWARAQGLTLEAIDLFTVGVHARRSRMMFAEALGPSVRVGILAAPPRYYDADNWWKSSNGAKTVIGESLALAWTVCCFRPPPPGSHVERWGPPPTRP
jgi:hypothetical protein